MHRRSTKTILEVLVIIVAVSIIMLTIYGESLSVFLAGSSEAATSQGYLYKLATEVRILVLVAVVSSILIGVYVIKRVSQYL